MARDTQSTVLFIEQGGLVVLGRPFISDAISGAGYLRVLYLDEEIR